MASSCVAHVEAGAQLPGNYISRAGVGAQIADGGHQAWSLESQPLHLDYPLRRARYRIVAQPHRCRARVTGPAGKGDFRAGLSGNCLHHAERHVFAFEQDALLDVELEERGYILAYLAVLDLSRI